MADLRGSRAAARGLGRRRPLSAPAAAGALVRLLTDRFPELAASLWTDEDTVEITVDGSRNVEVLQTLRDDPDLAFWWLADAAAVDYGPGGDDPHFEVVYHLYADRHPAWLRVRARVSRSAPTIRSVTSLWEGAMYHEREMYDMMGIVFEGNRDLRRIFMSPDYRSFPQRKDFHLPDDAADSPAAGVNPLERPETWDLTRFRSDVARWTEPLPEAELDAAAPPAHEAADVESDERGAP